MSEEKQYILRKPVVALQRKDLQAGAFVIEAFPDEIYVKNFIGYDMSCMPKNVFNELFVEFDEELLHQQICNKFIASALAYSEVLDDFYDKHTISSSKYHTQKSKVIDDFVEQVLGLIKGEQP